ncbi:MAG: hypothetical protein PHP39_08525 [Oscillospiraceae bacterium]|nr:hypothetical protein [Oscillospiraceae bacterium]
MTEGRRVFINRYWILALLGAGLLVLLLYVQSQSADGSLKGARSRARLYCDLLAETSDLEEQTAVTYLQEKLAAAQTQRSDQADNSDQADPELTIELCQQLISQYEHLQRYPDKLQEIQEQASQLSGISIFNRAGSFSRLNIERTARDFGHLSGIELRIGPDLAVTSLFSSKLADYAVLFLLLILVNLIMQERKRGLWSLIHATPGGRGRLAWQRVGLLGTGSVQAVLLLHGSKAAVSWYLYQGWGDLGRSLQSVEAFKHIPLRLSLGSALGWLLVYKCLAAFLVALCLWVLAAAVNNLQLGLGLAALVLTAEYAGYTLIRDHSALVWLRYLNLFAYIDPQRLFTTYLNIPWLGQALPGAWLTVGALPLLLLAVLAAAVLIQVRKYPFAQQNPLLRWLDRLQARLDRHLAWRSATGYELHKILVVHKGWIILLALLYLELAQAGVPLAEDSSLDAYAQAYQTQFAGVLDQRKLQQIAAEIETLESSLPASDQSDPSWSLQAQEQYLRLDALQTVQAEARSILAACQRQQVTPYLFNQAVYQALLGTDASTYRSKAALRLILAALLLLSPVLAYENDMKMQRLNRSTARGRGFLWRRKLWASGLILLLLALISLGSEIYRVTRYYGPLPFLQAPLQCVPGYEASTLNCPIGVFLTGIWLLRLLSLGVLGGLILLLSGSTSKRETALVANTVLWLLPAAGSVLLNSAALSYVSCLPALTVLPLLLRYPWAYAVLTLIGLAALALSWRQYSSLSSGHTLQTRLIARLSGRQAVK